MRLLAAVAAAVLLASCGGSGSSSSRACAFGSAAAGEATTYSGTSAGACMFPAGLSLYAAVGPAVYDGALAWSAVTGGAAPGRATIAWRFVPCPETGPVRFVASTGVNAWYASVVVQD